MSKLAVRTLIGSLESDKLRGLSFPLQIIYGEYGWIHDLTVGDLKETSSWYTKVMIFNDYYFSFQRFSTYLQEASGQKVCEDDQKEFLNGWYLLVIVSDLMAIVGSILKIEIQAKVDFDHVVAN